MTTVVVILLVVAAALASIPLFQWILDRREAAARSLPPLLIFPMASTDAQASPRTAHPPRAKSPIDRVIPVDAPRSHNGRPTPVDAPRSHNGRPTPVDAPRSHNGRPAPVDAPRSRNGRPAPADTPQTHNGRRPVPVRDDYQEDAQTVRFVRSVNEAVQLLPGRLEVLAGETEHHEIRFVRIPGEPLQLILGRDAGPNAQYVGLGSATVSRRHARLAYADGRWAVKNLSRTNPLVLNDDELSDTDAERTLIDGDRLELGEVVLRFHAH